MTTAERWAKQKAAILSAKTEIPIDGELLDTITGILTEGAVTISACTAYDITEDSALSVPLVRIIAPRPLTFFLLNHSISYSNLKGRAREADIAFFEERKKG